MLPDLQTVRHVNTQETGREQETRAHDTRCLVTNLAEGLLDHDADHASFGPAFGADEFHRLREQEGRQGKVEHPVVVFMAIRKAQI